MSDNTVKKIVIVGGGIIGCTTAYYLATHPRFASSSVQITVVEASRHGVAQGASGKAGGLVAKWAYPKELVDVSFPEHVRLATEHDGAARWGWRFVNCGSWEGRGEAFEDSDPGVGAAGGARKSLEKTLGLDTATVAPKTRRDSGLPDDLDWVKAELTDSYSPMAAHGGTAQVHPYLFTTSMLDLAKEKGVAYVSGKVAAIDIDRSAGGGARVTGVTYFPNPPSDSDSPATGADAPQPVTLPATHVILAAGAWSPRLLTALPIAGTRAHSITIAPAPGTPIAPYVLFTEIALPAGAGTASPEIYARPTGEVYCCGPGDDAALPDTVDDVRVGEGACESIWAHVASISPELRAGTVDCRQACFLPVVSGGGGGGPIVGAAEKIAQGLVVATGHTCWGICNAPGTAKALAELVMEGKVKCANLNKLSPSRFL